MIPWFAATPALTPQESVFQPWVCHLSCAMAASKLAHVLGAHGFSPSMHKDGVWQLAVRSRSALAQQGQHWKPLVWYGPCSAALVLHLNLNRQNNPDTAGKSSSDSIWFHRWPSERACIHNVFGNALTEMRLKNTVFVTGKVRHQW